MKAGSQFTRLLPVTAMALVLAGGALVQAGHAATTESSRTSTMTTQDPVTGSTSTTRTTSTKTTLTPAEWSTEDQYWRDNFTTRPYYRKTTTYSTYQPAYRYGAESYSRYNGRPFEEVEADLRADWAKMHGASTLTWEEARDPVRDSYTRIYTMRNADGSTTTTTTTTR